MRAVTQRLSAEGNSNWIVLDQYATSYSVALSLVFSSNANMTCNVQYTMDDPFNEQFMFTAPTRVTTTATLTLTNHGLTAADSIKVIGSGDPFDGTYAVATVTNQNVITYTVANSGLATGNRGGRVIVYRVQPHPVLTTITADADSNFTSPPRAVRFNCSVYTAGYCDFTVVQASK